MMMHETVNVWKNIHLIINEWIEEVILAGWNIFRDANEIEELAEKLTRQVVKSLVLNCGISEFEITKLLSEFYPTISNWIEEVLMNRWDFVRKKSKQTQLSIKITKKIIRSFLEEEDYIEFV